QSLEDDGINLMRVYLEDPDIFIDGNPSPGLANGQADGSYWLESQPSVYNDDMRVFMHNLMELADRHDIYLIFSAFDTFNFDESFDFVGPWNSAYGGPLDSIDDFFQTPETLEISKNRMDKLIEWVNESPHANRVMGWEALSEWDAFGWTLNSIGDGTPGREVEFRMRSQFMAELGAHIQQQDPTRIVFNSTIAPDPRGPNNRVTFLSRSFDALSPHLYASSNDEAVNNPDQFREWRAGVDGGNLTSYWLTQRYDRMPIINGEWGQTRTDWPGEIPRYTDPDLVYPFETPILDASGRTLTLDEDVDIFRTTHWASVAAGQAGSPLKIATEELLYQSGEFVFGDGSSIPISQGSILPEPFREIQSHMRNFFETDSLGVGWGTFSPDPLAGRLFTSTTSGDSLGAWGSSDGGSGLVYILRDRNVRSSGTADGSMLEITGLDRGLVYDIEVWDTTPGATAARATISDVFSSRGTLTIDLGSIASDAIVVFNSRPVEGTTQLVSATATATETVTFRLGLDRQPIAVIVDAMTGEQVEVDLAAETNFRGEVQDMTALTTLDGLVRLAIADDKNQMWFLSRTPAGAWTSVNLTALIDGGGIANDLSFYLPSWGTIHIAGLDAQGNAVNYWFAPGQQRWFFTNLTEQFGGPTLDGGGLTGFVAPWDALNLVGLSEDGDVVAYWWAPGLGQSEWLTLNMTQQFNGPKLTGQLDAFVTSWGAMNVTGLDENGNMTAYWWSPAVNRVFGSNDWRVDNLSAVANGPVFAEGSASINSVDGGLNLFGLDNDGDLILIRWTPQNPSWTVFNATEAVSAPRIDFPISAASAGNRITVGARDSTDGSFVTFTLLLNTETWTFEDSNKIVVL
ncbi:MAG: hypothetical protein AAF747_01290, partial [Planctomycetota bacterium]